MLKLLALSSRSATLLFAPKGAKYHLETDCRWTLCREEGGRDKTIIREGVTSTCPVYLSGLEPDTQYLFSISTGEFSFTTPPCSGLISILDHGATPASKDNASAIQNAIEDVPEGGTLLIPEGRFVSGPLFLKSGMTLLLEKGAELAAISDWRHWPILPSQDNFNRPLGTWEGLPEPSFASLINAIDCTDTVLTGDGIVDGGGDRGDWWSWPKETRRGARRPRTLFFAHSRNLHISGLTVRNSPSWTIHPFMCRDVTATALNIENPSDSPNTDGLNPESCENVILCGLHFSVGDDCIAIKSGKRNGEVTSHLAPSRNITITHCLMEHGHGAVVLGSEMSGGIRNVQISHCEFAGTDRGLRIKTRRGRGGQIKDIHMSNVQMDDVDTAVSANAFYFCDADGKSDAVQSRSPAPVSDLTPTVGGILIENVTATNVKLAAVALLGLPEAPLSNIQLHQISVTFAPSASAGVPLMALNVPECKHEQILADYSDFTGGISLLTEDEIHAD